MMTDQHSPVLDNGPERLTGRDILCFSHDWGHDPLSKNHVMRLLARRNRVLWVNSIGYRTPSLSKYDLGRAVRKLAAALRPLSEPEQSIFVLNPLVIPAHGRPALQALNRRLLRLQVRRAMRRLGFRRPLNWVFNPAAAVVAGSLGEETLIYYCVDQYTVFRGVASAALADLELRLLQRADLVLVSSARLYQSKSLLHPRTRLVRHGVDYEHFLLALDPALEVPAEIARLPRPIIGYFGLIAADWVDLELLLAIARRFASGSLVLLGKVTMDVSALERLPNVHLLGRKPYETLPAYAKGFDAAIIPFPVSEVTLNANPLKAREYLAAGLPVVSTPIPEVEVLGACRIGSNREALLLELQEALEEPGPSIERSRIMRSESWEARLEEIEGHVAELLHAGDATTRKEQPAFA
jgi:glycosyltransferase involved in cell wall biosynthesis